MAEPKPPRRNTQTGRPPTTAARSPAARRDSRASALHDAIAHSVETERDFKKKSSSFTGGYPRRNGMLALAAIMVAFTLYSWLGRPAFIWGAPVPVPAPEVQQANLRMSMFLFGMKVDRFRKQTGAYPESLDAMGDSVRGISYARVSDSTFELRGRAGNHEIVFRSDVGAAEFLGNTKELIQSRRRR